LRVLAIDDISLSVKEPSWDFVLGGVLDDGDNALKFFRSKFTSAAQVSLSWWNSTAISVPLVQVDISLLADQIGVTSSDTLDLGQGVHDLLFSIDVGIEETELEGVISLFFNRRNQLLTMN